MFQMFFLTGALKKVILNEASVTDISHFHDEIKVFFLLSFCCKFFSPGGQVLHLQSYLHPVIV